MPSFNVNVMDELARGQTGVPIADVGIVNKPVSLGGSTSSFKLKLHYLHKPASTLN